MTPRRIWIAASAVLAALVVVGYGMAHVLSGDAEVRISARVLDDGRTELALQQRSDGEWGDRVLPRARFFPAEAEQDQWLNSTPLSIETPGHESDDMLDEELRSAKEELAATQQALADAQKLVGVDIEELIAELEDTQAEATEANRSLEDSQAELKTATESLEEANTELAKYTAPIVRETGEEEYDSGRIKTSVSSYEPFGVTDETIETSITVEPTIQRDSDGLDIELRLICSGAAGVLDVSLIGFTSDYSRDPVIEYSLSPKPEDSRSVVTETWALQQDWNRDGDSWMHATSQYSSRLYHWLRQAETLEITIYGTDFKRDIELTFDLDGVFETPVQPNIDRCGQYY